VRVLSLFVIIPLVFLSAACEPTNPNLLPLLARDTIELTTPTSALTIPTAVDITPIGGEIIGGRWPEQLFDAGEFDLALRLVQGQLAFAPAGSLGIDDLGGRSRAGISESLAGRNFNDVRQVPAGTTFITDRPVTLSVGAVHIVRSRLIPCGFMTTNRFAKIQILQVDLAEQRAQFQIVSNERCGDQRLRDD
jgi:hypothetical protein